VHSFRSQEKKNPARGNCHVAFKAFQKDAFRRQDRKISLQDQASRRQGNLSFSIATTSELGDERALASGNILRSANVTSSGRSDDHAAI
jgi:hypothetical protein